MERKREWNFWMKVGEEHLGDWVGGLCTKPISRRRRKKEKEKKKAATSMKRDVREFIFFLPYHRSTRNTLLHYRARRRRRKRRRRRRRSKRDEQALANCLSSFSPPFFHFLSISPTTIGVRSISTDLFHLFFVRDRGILRL